MLIKNAFYKELVGNAVKILTVLVVILPVTELFKLLEQATSGNIPTVTIFTLMLYGTLASFPMILNIASFLAIVITMNRYSKDHELAVWLASGVSSFYWLRQTAIFLVPIMITCGVCSLYITPWAVYKSEQYAKYLTKQNANMGLTPGQFNESPDGKEVYYIEKYSLSQGYAKNVFLQYTDESNIVYNITAKEGNVHNDNGMMSMTLFNGNRYQISNFDKGNIINLHFNTMSATLKQTYDPDRDKVGLGDRSMPTPQLISLYETSSSLRGALSRRISVFIMTFIMGLIAVPLSMQTSRVQGSLVFILPPLIYGIYQNIVMSVESKINDGTLNSILYVFPVHIALLAFAIGMTYIKSKPNGYFRSKNK
ncbi:MAG: LPS export ABC transporter permease LptF [Burkholderiales bacterium]|nr:LPS export ABC transporter permease LptF [Burkholderiales bacterium]